MGGVNSPQAAALVRLSQAGISIGSQPGLWPIAVVLCSPPMRKAAEERSKVTLLLIVRLSPSRPDGSVR